MSSSDGEVGYAYYRREDYAGLFRRLACNGIDLGVILVAGGLSFVVAEALESEALLWGWLLVTYLYLTVLKRSVGTLGYLATGVRVVNLKGGRPSLAMLTLRLVWWILGPLNALIDLVYLTGDENRQPIRDKMMQTYVIRKAAQPAGTGPRRSVQLNFMGLALMVFEVARKPAESREAETPP